MAFITGTAANHTALWDTLLDFLQNNPTLVAAGQNWTKVWEKVGSPELMLKGPGLSGTDEIYVGLKRIDQRFLSDESEIQITGATGILTTATTFTGHVNSLVRTPRMFLDTNPMQYWIVGSGRRFVVLVKISTVYQVIYGGFFLPYGTPADYPYPMFIGGTTGAEAYSSALVTSWRESEQTGYRHFVYPQSDTGATSYCDSQAFMLAPDGIWHGGTHAYNGPMYAFPRFNVAPRGFPDYMGEYLQNDVISGDYAYSTQHRLGYTLMRERLMPGLNGDVPLTPITLMRFNNTAAPLPTSFGILDGAFSCAGVGSTAEAIVTIGGIDHLVVPNVMRTEVREYWALALE